METEVREPGDHLIDDLLQNAREYDFYTAARYLERYLSLIEKDAELKFRTDTSLAFPTADVTAIDHAAEDDEVTLTTAVLNIAGAQGPLPYTDTEALLTSTRNKDFAQQDYFDIFNHRLLQLLYANRKKQRFYFDSRPIAENQLSRLLFAFSGMRFATTKQLLPMQLRSYLHMTSLLVSRHCSAGSLRFFLETLYHVPVKVGQFDGAWWPLSDCEITKIGAFGKNQRLGINAVVGENAWDQASVMTLQIGPIEWEEYFNFLPHQPGYPQLKQTILFYTRSNYTCRICLQVAKAAVKPAVLGQGVYLGWTSWLPATYSDDYENRISFEIVGF